MNLDKKFKDFLIEDKSVVSTAIMVTNSPDFDFIGIADDKSISFREKEKESANPWDKAGRTKVKPGKFVTKAIKPVIDAGLISNRDVENWVNKFKAYFEEIDNIAIVAGDDIKWHYNSKNYTGQRGGSLWSCMSGAECQDRLDIYTQNPETVKLVVQYDEQHRVKTRAILWTLMDGQQLMDRIYYQTDHSRNSFAKLCAQNNWLLRDNVANKKFMVPIKSWAHKNYPYLDTMRFIERDGDNFFFTNFIEQSKRNSAYVIPNGTAGYTINNHVDVGGKWVPHNKAGICRVTNKGYLKTDLVEVKRQGTINKEIAKKDKWGNLFWEGDLVESKTMKGLIPKRAAYQLADGDWIGRKKYRTLVAKGKLADGSGHYNNKKAWVLEENVAKAQERDNEIKQLLVAEIVKMNARANRDNGLDGRSIRQLLETYNYFRASNNLEQVANIDDFLELNED